MYTGRSSPIGTTGFVNTAFELKNQINEGLIPEPRYIFCPLGSKGTLAGLVLGVQLARLKSVVIGVRVSKSHLGPLPVAISGNVLNLIKKPIKSF